MTKLVFISILFLLPTFLIGQTNHIVKQIFYDLPLDKSRTEIFEILKSEKRFKSTDNDTSYFKKLLPSFIGLCSDNGVVKSKPDSVEIELTWGIVGTPTKKVNKNNYSSTMFLETRYFYSSLDSVKKEYQNIVNTLRPIFKDTAITSIDTIFSESPMRSQFKATSMTFSNNEHNYKVQVLTANITKNYFGLFIEYERDEYQMK